MNIFGTSRPRAFHYTPRYAKRRGTHEGGAEADTRGDYELLRTAFRRRRKPSRMGSALRNVPLVIFLLLLLAFFLLVLAR